MTDPLIDKINKLSDKVKKQAYAGKKAYDQSSVGRFHKDVTVVQRFIFQFIRGINFLWKHIGSPIRKFFTNGISLIFFWYIDLWNSIVYKTDEYGKPVISIFRIAGMILATLFVMYLIISMGHISGIAILILASLALAGLKNKPMVAKNTIMALSIISIMFSELLFDGLFLYPLTSKVHVVYTKGLHEIDTDHNSGTHDTYSTGGCDGKPMCSEQETDVYRIRTLLFNNVYSWVVHHSLFYPDYVARAIPQETAKCLLHTWGWRQKFVGRNIYRSWDMYADILEARCVGINQEL